VQEIPELKGSEGDRKAAGIEEPRGTTGRRRWQGTVLQKDKSTGRMTGR